MIPSEVTDENASEYLADVDGILVPGGFGFRASEGKLVQLSMLEKTMYHSLVFVWECNFATVEFSRNVLGLEGAHSAELDPATPYPIIDPFLNKRYWKI